MGTDASLRETEDEGGLGSRPLGGCSPGGHGRRRRGAAPGGVGDTTAAIGRTAPGDAGSRPGLLPYPSAAVPVAASVAAPAAAPASVPVAGSTPAVTTAAAAEERIRAAAAGGANVHVFAARPYRP
jgi:hypothetical protein